MSATQTTYPGHKAPTPRPDHRNRRILLMAAVVLATISICVAAWLRTRSIEFSYCGDDKFYADYCRHHAYITVGYTTLLTLLFVCAAWLLLITTFSKLTVAFWGTNDKYEYEQLTSELEESRLPAIAAMIIAMVLFVLLGLPALLP